MIKHIPVLLNETITNLNIKEDGVYLDLTLGRAGHSKEILKRIPKGKLIAFDQDETAINESRKLLEEIGNNFILIHDNFQNVKSALRQLNINKIDGAMMDLGVSSPQFDDKDRGFSYNLDARLDMRMDLRNDLDAYKIINTYSKQELFRIFKEYGEDKYSYQIANNIEKYRKDKPITTTFELVDIIKKSKPSKELNKKGHPAKQIFQALRIEVNKEYEVLEKAITDVLDLLNKDARLCVITFQSGEDKIVKKIFKEKTSIEGNRRNDYIMINNKLDYELVNKKVIVPSLEEIENNHRSKSAKLRIIKRL